MRLFQQTWREKLVYFTSMLLSKAINGRKEKQAITPQHILCIKQDEIGDVVYSLHVYEMLHAQFPEAKITLLCKPFAITLLNNNPAITHLTSNFNDLIHTYDLIVDLRGSWRSIFFALTHWPKLRLDRATVRFENSQKAHHPHEVFTNLQIVESIITTENQNTSPQIFTGKADIKKADDFLIDNNIGRFALIHIGARKKLRKWNHYAELAQYLQKKYAFEIIFIGDKSDVKEIRKLQQVLPFETFSIANFFNLTELSAIAAKASLYVGNESGPLHIAAISGAPTLGLYGPGEPTVFYPHGPKTAFVHHVLECNPCDQVHCVHSDNPCINRITMMEVIDKIAHLLNE
jgi:ADP-heptose:LPS heptosyltransferase